VNVTLQIVQYITQYTTFTTRKLRTYNKKREIEIIKSLITQCEVTEVPSV